MGCDVRHQLTLRREFLLTVGTNVIRLLVRTVRVMEVAVDFEESFGVENRVAIVTFVISEIAKFDTQKNNFNILAWINRYEK